MKQPLNDHDLPALPGRGAGIRTSFSSSPPGRGQGWVIGRKRLATLGKPLADFKWFEIRAAVGLSFVLACFGSDKSRRNRNRCMKWKELLFVLLMSTAMTSAGQGKVVFEGTMFSKHFNTNRIVRIYLPPSYEREPERRFPVLYLHDGQNT